MIARNRFLMRFAFAGAIVVAIAAGVMTSAGQSTPRTKAGASTAPATSTAGLNQRYTACIKAHGATWTLIANSGGMYRVDIPAAANAQCAALDLAREAAGQGDATTASWLALIEAAPAEFWSCVGAAGFHTSGGSGQRSDYGSAAFGKVARDCAAAAGVTLPGR